MFRTISRYFLRVPTFNVRRVRDLELEKKYIVACWVFKRSVLTAGSVRLGLGSVARTEPNTDEEPICEWERGTLQSEIKAVRAL